jgi:ATP-dependent helicase HrpA
MTAIGLGDVAEFPFVEPPDRQAIRDGDHLLEELGALEEGRIGGQRRLTPIGRQLARLPIDPRLGRMVCLEIHLGVSRALSNELRLYRPLQFDLLS